VSGAVRLNQPKVISGRDLNLFNLVPCFEDKLISRKSGERRKEGRL